jgi:hypothetical protein
MGRKVSAATVRELSSWKRLGSRAAIWHSLRHLPFNMVRMMGRSESERARRSFGPDPDCGPLQTVRLSS